MKMREERVVNSGGLAKHFEVVLTRTAPHDQQKFEPVIRQAGGWKVPGHIHLSSYTTINSPGTAYLRYHVLSSNFVVTEQSPGGAPASVVCPQ